MCISASAPPRCARSTASTSTTPPCWRCAARSRGSAITPHHVLIDGKPIRTLGIEHTAVVGGDDACYSIACASIVAKVTRDRLMHSLAPRYPDYSVGDRTSATRRRRTSRRLGAAGLTPHHRRSFVPCPPALAGLQRRARRPGRRAGRARRGRRRGAVVARRSRSRHVRRAAIGNSAARVLRRGAIGGETAPSCALREPRVQSLARSPESHSPPGSRLFAASSPAAAVSCRDESVTPG